MLKVCDDETFDFGKSLDLKEVIKLLESQNLSGSAERLKIDKLPHIQDVQHQLLLKWLPFREAVLFKHSKQTAVKGWNAELIDLVWSLKCTEFAPYQAVVHELAVLYKLRPSHNCVKYKNPKLATLVRGA